jgi:Leucine-rich repeat (LRR) protein
LNHNLTIYYVIDKDKSFGDLNYAVVILVEPYGGKRIADGQNMAGGYSGHKREAWATIVSKVPKLEGKEHLFVADPLSQEEQREMNNYKNASIQSDAIKELGSEQAAEMWLEIASPDLTYRGNGNDIYRNFTENLKHKYLGLGMDLTADMINNSEPSVLKYYAARKLQGLMSKSLGQLTDTDIAFINSPIMRENKKKLKEKYSGQLGGVTSGQADYVGLEYPKDDNSKYVALFGFDDFFEHIPVNTKMIQMENTSKTPIALDIPESIGKLTELKTLIIDNMVKSIPESIRNCTKLKFINLPNNPQLESIPEAFAELHCLNFLSTENSNPNMRIPSKLEEYMVDDEGFWYINFPPELKKHCGPVRS